MYSLGGDLNQECDQWQSGGGGGGRNGKTGTVGKMLSFCFYSWLSLSIHKRGVIFGDGTTSGPDIFNWGKGRRVLNMMHLDSCGTTHIKSARGKQLAQGLPEDCCTVHICHPHFSCLTYDHERHVPVSFSFKLLNELMRGRRKCP